MIELVRASGDGLGPRRAALSDGQLAVGSGEEDDPEEVFDLFNIGKSKDQSHCLRHPGFIIRIKEKRTQSAFVGMGRGSLEATALAGFVRAHKKILSDVIVG